MNEIWPLPEQCFSSHLLFWICGRRLHHVSSFFRQKFVCLLRTLFACNVNQLQGKSSGSTFKKLLCLGLFPVSKTYGLGGLTMECGPQDCGYCGSQELPHWYWWYYQPWLAAIFCRNVCYEKGLIHLQDVAWEHRKARQKLLAYYFVCMSTTEKFRQSLMWYTKSVLDCK